MVVKLRLARHGQRNTPYYHIVRDLVAINARKRRDARPLEKLGEYDPVPRIPGTSPWTARGSGSGTEHYDATEAGAVRKEKRVEWDVARIRYWLGVGAQPTNTVVKLLERGGVLTGDHKWRLHPTKSALNNGAHPVEAGAAAAAGEALAGSEGASTDAAQAIASSAEAASTGATASA